MNEKFFSLPEEKQQAILNGGYRVFSQHTLLNLDPDQFIPGLDIQMIYRDMYWASEGYLWEMAQKGNVDVLQMEKDFTRLIEFWKSIYLKKEG